MALYFLLFFGLAKAAPGNDGDLTFVLERWSKPFQQLSKYSWYGNVALQRFHIPEETVVAHFIFTVKKDHTLQCPERNVTIYIRQGAPPVINPIGTAFPEMTLWKPPTPFFLSVTSSSKYLSLDYPAPGDWFVATHLPEDDGHIVQKGFPSCSYLFGLNISIWRAVDTPILQKGIKITQKAAPNKPARLKLYVPQFSSSLSLTLDDCTLAEGAGSGDCSLGISIGSRTLQEVPLHFKWSGKKGFAFLAAPPWDTWLRVNVETYDNQTVTFSILSDYTVQCKPTSEGLPAKGHSRQRSTSNSSLENESSVAGETLALTQLFEPPTLLPSACVWSFPVCQEEVNTFLMRFLPVHESIVSVSATCPTLLTYPLPAQVTGGTLNLKLTLNTINATLGNSSNVVACFSLQTPVLHLNNSLQCHTGYGVKVNASFPEALLRLPFPRSGTWYLSLQLMCNSSDCGGVSVVSVVPDVFINACIEDCGEFGECRLLTSSSYQYCACVCKSGWRGWGCTDNSKAVSFAHQVFAALLLTLSNLSFLPAIVLAVKRLYITEASVYFFTMFFSTFYHACDQPGKAVFCIMSYNTLQYCDFLGSICSIWVTLLCMARVRRIVKHTLFLVGTLLIAMSLQLDRRGLWNLLGPILTAMFFMVAVWVRRGVKRGQCYPPSWQRWVFYLIPGMLCALIGISLYVFAQTEENYYYTHSIWHILVASCILFLLPPREKSMAADKWIMGWQADWNGMWRWSPRICGYTLCQSSKDECHTVT